MKDAAELLFSALSLVAKGLDFRTWTEGGPRDVYAPYYMIARQLAIFPLSSLFLPFAVGIMRETPLQPQYAGPR